MGFTTAEADSDSALETSSSARPSEPTPTQLQKYLIEETAMDADAACAKIQQAQDEIPFLTDLAAAYLVAQRHGLQPAEVFETAQRNYSLDIENLQPEMNSVDLTATINQITAINTFDKDGGEGKVCNIILQDETGTAVLTLWDDQTAVTEDLEKGVELRIENGYSKAASDYCQDRFGCSVEVRVGDGKVLRKEESEWKILI